MTACRGVRVRPLWSWYTRTVLAGLSIMNGASLLGRRRVSSPWGALWLAVALAPMVAAPVQGLDPSRRLADHVVRTWGIESGLPQYSVNSVVQTRDGYLWAGTQEGLVRFDGVRFTVYDTGLVSAMQSSFIQVLLEDVMGRLWVGTNGGGLLRLEDGEFRLFGVGEGLPSDVVLALCEERDGAVLVGTERGLVRIRDDRVEVPVFASHLPHAKVSALLADRDGGLWIGTYGGGLLYHTPWARELVTTADGLPDNVVLVLYQDREDRVWAGTYDGGLAVREGGRWRAFAQNDRLGSKRVMALFEDRQGALWVGTYGAGLARLFRGEIDWLTEAGGLAGNVVMSIAQDREGSLWVGTETGGLTQVRNGKFIPVTTRHGLSHPVVFGVLEDRHGDVWLGTAAGGLNRLRAGTMEVFNPAVGFPSDHVGGIAESRDGDLWVGIRTGLVKGRPGRWQQVRLPGPVRSPFVWAMHEDRDGTLWVGSDGGGLQCRRLDGRWEVHSTETGFPSNLVRAIVRDGSGALWAGTAGGLARLRDGEWRTFTQADGLPNDYVVALFEDRVGAVWVGTMTGLGLVQGERVTGFPRTSGVPGEAVLSIQEDDKGFLWMGFNKGLVRISRQDLERWAERRSGDVPVVWFGTSDGMPSAECNGGSQPSSWRTRSGRLLFPTVRGVAVVDPAHLPSNAVPPPVLVEEVKADGRALPLADGVVVPAGTRRLEILYTALSLVDPDRVFFRHQLEGFDPEPLEVGRQRSVTFTGLRPGEYRFWVTACNEDGRWNEDGTGLQLRVVAHLWQTRLFQGLVALLAVGALVVASGWRVKQIRRHEQELERLVRERTEQLRQTNQQLEEQRHRLAQANRMLQRLAVIDPLTAVANRRRFADTLEVEWRRAQRQSRPLSLLMVDIDAFKAFNDHHGHQAGDSCLRQVAEALAAAASRPGDTVARYGGEEFVILLADTDLTGSLAVAERVRSAVEALAIPHGFSAAAEVVTVSVGCATLTPDAGLASDVLITLADAAMYSAKREGRNRVMAAVNES